jgi:hypothetical protein
MLKWAPLSLFVAMVLIWKMQGYRVNIERAGKHRKGARYKVQGKDPIQAFGRNQIRSLKLECRKRNFE